MKGKDLRLQSRCQKADLSPASSAALMGETAAQPTGTVLQQRAISSLIAYALKSNYINLLILMNKKPLDQTNLAACYFGSKIIHFEAVHLYIYEACARDSRACLDLCQEDEDESK